MYTATPEGRRAFRNWLTTPAAPPVIEIEAILRVMFADRGTKAQLLAALRGMSRQARELQARALAQGAGYRPEGELADRLHLVATGGRFVHEYADMLNRYAEWAIAEVESWPSTGPDASPRGRELLEEQLALFH